MTNSQILFGELLTCELPAVQVPDQTITYPIYFV
jgi:hypothetical protein